MSNREEFTTMGKKVEILLTIFALCLMVVLVNPIKTNAEEYSGEETGTVDISTCTIVEVTDYARIASKEIVGTLVVKDGDSVLVESVDYTIKLNPDCGYGQHSGYVYGEGKYTGRQAFKYTIVADAPVIESVKVKTVDVNKGEIAATFLHGFGKTMYHEMQVSDKKDFSSVIASNSTNDYEASEITISDLKPGKTYYVRVRAYYENARTGEKFYSSWTEILSKEIKAKVNKKCKVKEADYIGTYYKKGSKVKDTYTIIIESIENGYVNFSVQYQALNGKAIYYTGRITTPVNNKKATFKWTDSWGNSGTGTLNFVKKHQISLQLIQKKTAKINRSSMELKKTTNFIYYKKKHEINQTL